MVTGPVTLDLADVIAQLAFRPKAARLARAVRDQLALVHMEDERARSRGTSAFAGFSQLVQRSKAPSPIHERPAWSGVMDVTPPKRAFTPGSIAPITTLVQATPGVNAVAATPPAGYGLPSRYCSTI